MVFLYTCLSCCYNERCELTTSAVLLLDNYMYRIVIVLHMCLFVYSHTSNFSAIWWLSPLPVTGLQI
jgi:hypothetical protein